MSYKFLCDRDARFARVASFLWSQDLPWDSPETLHTPDESFRPRMMRHQREILDADRLRQGKRWVESGNPQMISFISNPR